MDLNQRLLLCLSQSNRIEKQFAKILHNEGIDILGATSCGEFINGYQDEGSTVILLLNLHPESYTILS